MNTHISPCMGGWCTKRDKCAHYVNPTTVDNPPDRLCDRGSEDRMFFLPLHPKQDEAVPA